MCIRPLTATLLLRPTALLHRQWSCHAAPRCKYVDQLINIVLETNRRNRLSNRDQQNPSFSSFLPQCTWVCEPAAVSCCDENVPHLYITEGSIYMCLKHELRTCMCSSHPVALPRAVNVPMTRHAHVLTCFERLERYVTCRRDLQAGSQAYGEISLSSSLLRGIELILRQCILPVKHMIPEPPFATILHTAPLCVLEANLQCMSWELTTQQAP